MEAAPGIDAAGLSAMGQSLQQLQQRAREVGVEEAATLDMRWAGVVDGGGKSRPDSAPTCNSILSRPLRSFERMRVRYAARGTCGHPPCKSE